MAVKIAKKTIKIPNRKLIFNTTREIIRELAACVLGKE
jgi:hypothetical protein